MAEAQPLIAFKVLLAGSSFKTTKEDGSVGEEIGVGKTAFLTRFAENRFDEKILRPTIGAEFRSINFPDRNLKIQIWDTSKSEDNII